MPKLAGLKSGKKLKGLAASAAGGEKKFGDIVGSEAGTGDNIPARPELVAPVLLLYMSIPSRSSTSLPIFAGEDFSIVASFAAGDMDSAADCGATDELEAPVRRWTSDMNSLGFVWMTLGETV